MDAETIETRYRRLTPKSRKAFEAGRPFLAGPAKGAYFYPPYPLTLSKGKGCKIWDVDGRDYLDFANHHTVQVLGHNHPSIMAAVERQLKKGIALGSATGVETEIAREMCRRVATVERIRFVNSGTEATLHAIRLARGYSRKPKIAKFEGGYHGSHDAVEVSVAPPLEVAGPAHAPRAVPGVGGMSAHAVDEVVILPYNDEEAVARLVEEHRNELACVIFDPKAGILPQRPAFVQAVREITRKHGVLLIFDEVVGYRVGAGGLQAHYGIDPDLTCFGKLIGGGFPAGAFGGRAEIIDLFDTSKGSTGFSQSGSFSAHPVTMAAGLAALQALTSEAYEHLNGLGARLEACLKKLFSDLGVDAFVVVTGSVFSVHFTRGPLANYRDLARVDSGMAYRVFLSLLNQGYFLCRSMTMCAISTPTNEGYIDDLVGAMGRAVVEAREESARYADGDRV
jgi:glutamate-1-semialdehyde 2,1-aminomutase